MVNRCTNPKNDSFKNYGGRGITVCQRWRKFENFLADMGHRPPGLTIERNNNDKGYEPGNCRWATRKEQQANRRPSRGLPPQGERHGRAKLSEADVREIRARPHENQRALAAEFEVRQTTISSIIRRKIWKHV